MTISEKLVKVAENSTRIYDTAFSTGRQAGHSAGYTEGYTEGYADGEAYGKSLGGYTEGYDAGEKAGEKAQYDAFWDAYQENGNKTVYTIYQGGFAGPYWTDETFRPKYPIRTTDATLMFRATRITDLTKPGIHLDFSGCKVFNYAFAYSYGYLRKLPQLDLSGANNLVSTFDSYDGTEMSLIVSENTIFASSTFNNVTKLTDLTISGTIGKALNLNSCKALSNESIQNVIDHLADLTGQTTQTLTLNAEVGANCTDGQKALITAKNWTLVY